MLLRVDLDGRSWFADVAFGSTTQTAPLEFLLSVPQKRRTACSASRRPAGRVQPGIPDRQGWSTVYQYGLRPAPAVDFEIGNWYTSSHPQSVFLSDLIISRTAPGLRELLVNDVLTLRGTRARPETRRYDDAGLGGLPARAFRIGPAAGRRPLFERAATSGRQAAAGELTAGCARHAVSPGRAPARSASALQVRHRRVVEEQVAMRGIGGPVHDVDEHVQVARRVVDHAGHVSEP